MNNGDFIISCQTCGTKNRVPGARIDDNPVCGKCRTLLPTGNIYNHPVDITDQTFFREIIEFPGTVLLDCWAPWCGPCKSVAPVLDQLAKEFAGQIKIAKLNVDQNQRTASEFSIQSIPTMLFFKNGKKVKTLVGALPKNEIVKNIKTLL